MSGLPETFVPGFHDENSVRKMKYSKFGNTGMSVSQLALGTATFSALFGEFSFEQCKATLHEAIKKGINYIDTAPYYGYGVSEEILGKCLEGIPRKAYYIATKVARYGKGDKLIFDFSAKKTKESFDASLKRLNLDYVDVLQIHDIDYASSLDIVLNETLPAVKEIADQGKARFIGVTGYTVSVLAECVQRSSIKIDTVLFWGRLALLNQDAEKFIPVYKSKNLGMVNAAVNCQGLLSNFGEQPWNAASKEIKDACAEAREYCKQNGVELGRLAVYFAFQQDGPHTALVGMNTTKVLEDNLDVFYNGLTEKEQKVYEHVQKIFSKLEKSHWEGVEVARYLEQK